MLPVKIWTTLAVAAALVACSGEDRLSEDGDLQQLLAWMSGSFSSEAQSVADSGYSHIVLQMVPIWSERSDGSWLYVEQAAASELTRPYRQRVYRVTATGDGVFRSDVFEIADPLRFAGSGREEEPLSTIDPDSLMLRDGCGVILRRVDDSSFLGSTEGTGCTSNLRGASYATSEVSVGADRLVSWDRGFDSTGAQVWGATSGPYIFLRKNR